MFEMVKRLYESGRLGREALAAARERGWITVAQLATLLSEEA